MGEGSKNGEREVQSRPLLFTFIFSKNPKLKVWKWSNKSNDWTWIFNNNFKNSNFYHIIGKLNEIIINFNFYSGINWKFLKKFISFAYIVGLGCHLCRWVLEEDAYACEKFQPIWEQNNLTSFPQK